MPQQDARGLSEVDDARTIELEQFLASVVPRATTRAGRHVPVPGWHWDAHVRDYDLWLLEEGVATVAGLADVGDLTVRDGSLLVLRPGDRAALRQVEASPVRVLYVHFQIRDRRTDAHVTFPPELAPSRYRASISPGASALIKRAVREIGRHGPLAEVLTTGVLTQLLAMLCLQDLRRGATSPVSPALSRAVDLLEQRPASRWTLSRLADEVGVAPRRLSRLFASELGTTFRASVIGARLEHARALVEETSLPIGTIARALGYPDHVLFSKQFRARFGRSPAQHRQS